MKFVRHHLLTVYAIFAFAYLLVPIGLVILFSFNNPKGRFNYTWQGFTLDHWRNWDAVPGLRDAMTRSLEIALFASIAATVLGTLIALALVRYRFHGHHDVADAEHDVRDQDRAEAEEDLQIDEQRE